MKQGTEYVYVKVSLALFDARRGKWSMPVQIKIDEDYSGDIAMITRDVTSLSLKDLVREEVRDED